MSIHRSDYTPPDWLVPNVALDIALTESRARITTRLTVTRNGTHNRPLRLDGENLKLVSLTANGKPVSHKLDKTGLTVRLPADSAELEIVSECAITTEQRGLFAAGDLLITQCEPQGFRRIAFFPDRPDILARWRTRIIADASRFPVLLAGGNPIGNGALPHGRHWAEWEDPHPRPSYLFALAAGDLAANRSRHVRRSGEPVDLAIWARAEDLPGTAHAMDSLEKAMAWDAAEYGCDYDLDRFDVVAVPGYAFGGVEAKGLNLIETGLLLADPETATDAELDAVTTLVAHEYCHNWSGNRVTIREWFELGLKEGLTVFRDQRFLASLGSASVKRIQDVKALRMAQFTQDASAEAHPVRPDTRRSFDDLYSTTVYTKGGELVRMLHTILGDTAFKAGLSLFFARHDGTGATCDDLVAAMAEAGGIDLPGFSGWYAQSGTPALRVDWDGERATVTQQGDPLPVPLRAALFDGGRIEERLLLAGKPSQQFVFEGAGDGAVLSVNRGFSAPVRIACARSDADLGLLARSETDGFARWDAIQQLMTRTIVENRSALRATEALEAALADPDRGFAAEAATLPAEALVAEQVADADPAQLRGARLALRAELGRALEPQWRAILAEPVPDKGARALRGVALDYLLASGAPDAGALALRQLTEGPSMTERLGALKALADSDAPERAQALAAFHARWRAHPALLDQWFSIQALSLRADTVTAAPRLLAHPDFTLAHPTRLSAIAGAFGANFGAFHDGSGRGYAFLADIVLAADRIDPRMSTALVRPLTRWQGIEPVRAAAMRGQLARVAQSAVSPQLRALAAESGMPAAPLAAR